MKLIIVTLLLLASSSYAREMSRGSCPKPTAPPAGFDISKYLGVWYEIERTNLIFEVGLRCVQAKYTLGSDGNVIVENSGINEKNETVSMIGSGRITELANVLGVKFFPSQPEAPYWIVDTDFETYSVVFTCNEVNGNLNTKNGWILSRTPKLSQDIRERMVRILGNLGISETELSETDQSCWE